MITDPSESRVHWLGQSGYFFEESESRGSDGIPGRETKWGARAVFLLCEEVLWKNDQVHFWQPWKVKCLCSSHFLTEQEQSELGQGEDKAGERWGLLSPSSLLTSRSLPLSFTKGGKVRKQTKNQTKTLCLHQDLLGFGPRQLWFSSGRFEVYQLFHLEITILSADVRWVGLEWDYEGQVLDTVGT